MVLSLMAAAALAAQCAPTVAPSTLLSIAQVESGFDPLAIGVNRPVPARLHPRTPAQAAAMAARLIAGGADIDLGIAQINSRNLGWLGLSVESAFDPCQNLAAAAHVLADGYDRGRRRTSDPQSALKIALSYYNTGGAHRGFTNGYVAKVAAASGQAAPALSNAGQTAPRQPAIARPKPRAPAWDVFAAISASGGDFVLNPSPSGDDH